MPEMPGLVLVERFDLSGKINLPADRRYKTPDLIVIHRNTASERWFREHPEDVGKISHVEALAKFHARPGRWHFRLFPYHYFVDKDGIVYQVHTEMNRSPHARGLNERAIGVCLNVDGRREEPTEAQWNAAVLLCAQILKRRPKSDIIGHSLKKRCPGPKVNVAALGEEARKLAGEETHGVGSG